MAPKLSVLQKAFARKDLTVVAIYIETCDGVPDHAAELRRQVAKHRIDYPVLDGTAGTLRDPTRKRFPGAPHALVVDREGRIVRAYGYMPRMRTLREDLEALVATGVLRERPHDGWLGFPRRAWVEVRIESHGPPRIERRTAWTAKRVNRVDRDFKRTEREPETITVDGRKVTARVFEATWKRLEMTFKQRRWIANSTVVRRETVETCPDGSRVVKTERLAKWSATLSVGERNVACRLVERTVAWSAGRTKEQIWISEAVPGQVVKHIRKTVSDKGTNVDSETVVAFGLR